MALRYTERDWEFLEGEAWFREWAADREMRSPEQMHRDGVSKHQQADLSGELYDNEVHADVRVTEHGTGDSVKCYDGAYRQIIVQNATEHGLEPGDFATVEVIGHQTVYAFAEPVTPVEADDARAETTAD